MNLKPVRIHLAGLLVLLSLALSQVSASAQAAGDYKSVGSGLWTDLTVWQKYDGTTWNAATTAPAAADGVITITTSTSVTNSATKSADQVVVQAGAVLATTASLTIAHGTGTDLDVSGTVVVLGNANSLTLAANAVVVVESGGVMIHNGSATAGVNAGAGSTITFQSGGKFQLLRPGATIYTGVWNAGSICEIAYPVASTSKPGGLAQTFANFNWNFLAQAAGVDLSGGLANVAGNLTVLAGPTNASTELKLNAGFTVGGDLVIDNGSLNLAGSGGPWVWNLAGNLFIAPGAQLNLTDGTGGTYTLVFNGSSPQTYQCLGANIATKLNWTINSGATLNLSNNAPVSTAGRVFTANGTAYVNGNIVFADGIAGTGTILNQGGGNGLLDIGVGGANNTLDGTLTLGDGASGTLGLAKSGAGTLTINSNNAIGGGLVVSNGTALVNNPTGSGTGSGAVTVIGGTLGGSGIISGTVNVAAGGALAPGNNAIGTLTINNNLTLAGTTRIEVNTAGSPNCDKLNGLHTVTYGGVLNVVTTGSPTLTTADSFKIFTATTYTGAFASINPTTPASGLLWDTNTLATDGTLRIQSGVNTTPTNLVAVVSGNQLNLSWPADHTGWRLQAQTNALGTGLGTNWVDVPGTDAANFLNVQLDTTRGNVFYRMIYP